MDGARDTRHAKWVGVVAPVVALLVGSWRQGAQDKPGSQRQAGFLFAVTSEPLHQHLLLRGTLSILGWACREYTPRQYPASRPGCRGMLLLLLGIAGRNLVVPLAS